jgi:sodium-independent sulfate anion transporter 11
VTAAQALIDLRNQFDRYADPDRVEWHFAGVANRWTKRALVASGFGAERKDIQYSGSGSASGEEKGVYEPLIAVAEAGGARVDGNGEGERTKAKEVDIEAAGASTAGEISPVASSSGGVGGRLVPLYGVNRPYFHVDVETAVAGAIRNLGRRGAESSGRE